MPEERVSGSSTPQPPTSVPGRINRLFEVTHPPDNPEREYRNREVVEACRAAGREMSESHLSEVRRGLKTPTLRVLEPIAWFFQVPVGYFVDPGTAAEIEGELAVREAQLNAKLKAKREAREDRAAAARELQQAIRTSGVTKTAHRGAKGKDDREQAAMMRALAQLIRDDDED
jgi:hypothetical protein